MRVFNVTFDARDAVALARFWFGLVQRPVDVEANEFCVGSHH